MYMCSTGMECLGGDTQGSEMGCVEIHNIETEIKCVGNSGMAYVIGGTQHGTVIGCVGAEHGMGCVDYTNCDGWCSGGGQGRCRVLTDMRDWRSVPC